MDQRKCQYCGYVWESAAQREEHETEIERIASIFGRTTEEVEGIAKEERAF